MIFAYILGKIEKGNETSVFEALKQMEKVKKVSLIYGIYDLCVEAEFETMEELDAFVFNIIRKLQGIKDTCTLIVARIYSKQ